MRLCRRTYPMLSVLILALVASACAPGVPLPASEGASPAATAPAPPPQTSTPDPRLVVWPRWQEFEQSLVRAILGAQVANSVCDWALLGRAGNSFYVWAVCAGRSGPSTSVGEGVTLATMPAVLRVSENNTAVGTLVPRDGSYYTGDVQRLFPNEAQVKIFANAVEPTPATLERHARLRLKWPGLPPIGADEVAPPQPQDAAAGPGATLRIFSGRPDPAWTLTLAELAQLDTLVRQLTPGECGPLPDNLGYRGVAVTLGMGDAGNLVAYGGKVMSGDTGRDASALCLEDPDGRIEAFLISSAQPHIEPGLYALLTEAREGPPPTPVITVSPTPALPLGWTRYADEGLGIEYSHPEAWQLTTITDWSRVYSPGPSEPNGSLAAPSPFWLTVLGPGFTNEDASAYNFWEAASIAQAWDTPARGTLVSPHAPEGYNTYTRLPDTAVDGFPAAVLDNPTVWEMPRGTRERRVLVKVGEWTVMFGAYYATPEELATFEQVLASVRFGSLMLARGAASLTPQAPPTSVP